jgi:hypothetical protein
MEYDGAEISPVGRLADWLPLSVSPARPNHESGFLQTPMICISMLHLPCLWIKLGVWCFSY